MIRKLIVSLLAVAACAVLAVRVLDCTASGHQALSVKRSYTLMRFSDGKVLRATIAVTDGSLWVEYPRMLDPQQEDVLAGFPLLPLFILLGFYPALWAARKYKNVSPASPGQCQKCGYDLTGNESGVCPECGSSVPGRVGVGKDLPPPSGAGRQKKTIG